MSIMSLIRDINPQRVFTTHDIGKKFLRVARSAVAPFGWISAVIRIEDRWRQRQALRDLDEHMLRDIGITRDEAEREAKKPFWR